MVGEEHWLDLEHERAHESLAHLRTDSAMTDTHTFDYYKRYVILCFSFSPFHANREQSEQQITNEHCTDPSEPYR